MMTGMPAASALAFASSLITPSCIQMYLAPTSMASSTTGMTWSEWRKTSTNVDGFGNGLEVRVAFLPKGLFDHRIDRDNPVALALHVTGDPVAVPVGVVGKTDDRDGLAVS